MTEAFVLINCTLGKEDRVLNKLREIEEISEISKTYGVYDMIVKLESQSEKDLTRIISSQIRNIEPVDAVLTLFAN